MELSTVNVLLNVDVENDNPPAPLSREANATSDGEFARVGTAGVRTVFESLGKTRYISMTTSETLGRPPVGPGTNIPINDAELTNDREPRTKSSAASISNPGVAGREAIPIRPLGARLL
jgi:hypothetical protein